MNCMNCNNYDTLPFTCQKCNKHLCRKCISKDKHICIISNNLILNSFCNNENCLRTDNLINCKYCDKKFCKFHINHDCPNKYNFCCCIC